MTPLVLDRYSKSKSLRNSDFLYCQPSRGGYIVELRGEYMGYVKKLKAGWKLEPVGMSEGRQKDTLREATVLIDEYHARPTGGSARAARARYSRRR